MASSKKTEYSNLDRQIEQLMECRPLAEAEVKQLCEKVCNYCEEIIHPTRLKKFCNPKAMFNQFEHQLLFVGIFMVNSMT
jgi:putative methionine-R-sulfoxide reductase with GAF domain